MVYDTGLVDIKALYELPQRYDPQLANINFIAAACITLAYNITPAKKIFYYVGHVWNNRWLLGTINNPL